MTDRQPTGLPTPEVDEELDAALRPLFDQSAAVPSAEVMARLTAHAASVPTAARATRPLRRLALAAIALLTIAAGQWIPSWNEEHPVVAYDDKDLDDTLWLDSDELGDGFDLLVLSTHTDNPERARDAVDALLAELGEDT